MAADATGRASRPWSSSDKSCGHARIIKARRSWLPGFPLYRRDGSGDSHVPVAISVLGRQVSGVQFGQPRMAWRCPWCYQQMPDDTSPASFPAVQSTSSVWLPLSHACGAALHRKFAAEAIAATLRVKGGIRRIERPFMVAPPPDRYRKKRRPFAQKGGINGIGLRDHMHMVFGCRCVGSQPNSSIKRRCVLGWAVSSSGRLSLPPSAKSICPTARRGWPHRR